jgi:hypothetical protein
VTIPSPDGKVPARIALILLISVLVGLGAGGLTYLASGNVPQAILTGLLLSGGAYAGFDRSIGA